MKNGLYVVSTPIGNPSDITLHALEVLNNTDFILCEDTRKTDYLLKHHNIKGKKLLIFNEHSQEDDIKRYIEMALSHKVALVSDAGTPLVCDPGFTIINKARQHGVFIKVALGACALIGASTLCGININNTLFLGFFSKKTAFDVKYTNAIYVAPHDVIPLLNSLKEIEINYDIKISIAREVTKTFEEALFFNGTPEASKHFDAQKPMGEFTIFINFDKKQGNIKKEVFDILADIPNWELLPKKPLARFISKYFMEHIPQKEIYEILTKSE